MSYLLETKQALITKAIWFDRSSKYLYALRQFVASIRLVVYV